MKKGILLSILAVFCCGLVSAQSLSNKRVEKFRVTKAELPSLLEDLDLDPSLAETVVSSGDIEVMRITESAPARTNAFFFEFDEENGFDGAFEDLEDLDLNLFKLEQNTEELSRDMERLAEKLSNKGDQIEKRIKLRFNRDGEDATFEWDGQGDMPEELKERMFQLGEELQDMDFDIAVEIEEDQHPFAWNHKTEKKPLLGVYHETHEKGGVAITGIIENSGAEKAGLQKGDRVLALDGQDVDDAQTLREYILSKEVGDDIKVDYIRGESAGSVTATLGTQKSKNQWKPSHGYYPHHKKAMLGVNLNLDEEGLQVTGITEDSNADRLGIQAGDRITAINGNEINTLAGLREAKQSLKAGEDLSVTVERDNQELTLRGTWVDKNAEAFKGLKTNRTFMFEPAPKDKEIIIIRPVDELPVRERNIGFTDIRVFPNPSSGNINLDFQGTEDEAAIRISDISGKVVYQRDVTPVNGRINENITLDQPVQGTLFVSVIQGDEVHTQRLINN